MVEAHKLYEQFLKKKRILEYTHLKTSTGFIDESFAVDEKGIKPEM